MSAPRWTGIALPSVLILAALWSAVPLAVWWDGADPAYFATAWGTWGWGSALALLATVLLAVLTRGRIVDAALRGWRILMAAPPAAFAAAGATLFASLALLTCLVVFDGNPRNVDGFAQLFQARIFQAGRTWAAPPAELANFATLQMILGPDRWYAQYPYGQSLLLAGSLSLGAWWLHVAPLAALFALAVYRVARWCADEAVARLSLLLLSASPFVVAVAGSEMSHLAAATLGMGAAAAAAATDRRPLLTGALAGAALGLMTAFRPLDAIAAAAPVAIILAWTTRRIPALAGAALAGTLATLPTLWYNAATTGHWRTFGYTALWGPQHSLGFHDVPWGVPLTFARAVARSGLDLHQLNLYLFDATVPALVVIAAGFALGRRSLTARDAVPLAAAAALTGLLFFYWHRDVFYGPRFLYGIAGWCVVLFARAMVLLRRTGVAGPAPGAGPLAALFVGVALLLGLATITPGRMDAYRRSTPIFGLHPDRDASLAGIGGGAVVLIPDGWGSRLIARLWQAGIPVRRSTRLYAAIDACTIEEALGAAGPGGGAPGRLGGTLDSLAALGRPGARAGLTADANLRLRASPPPGPACAAEIAFDRRGYYSFAPYLWLNTASLDGPIVWARDLGAAGNAALRARYPGRRFFRYAPGADGRPAFTPLDGPDAAR